MSLRSLCAATALLILVGCSNKRDVGNIPDGGGGTTGSAGTGAGTAGQGGGGQGGGNAGPCDGGTVFICVDATLVCNPADCPGPTGTAGTGGGAGRGGAGGSATGAGGSAG